MANKRMFSKDITESDAFLEMPPSSQLLYFHLAMNADDEGFVGNPKKIMRMCGFADDDLKILIGKRFLIVFESGVLVIKHWLIHNTIRMDRFSQTNYEQEKKMLTIKDNKAYTETCQPNGNQMEPQVKLSKVNLSKVKLVDNTQQKTESFILNVKEVVAGKEVDNNEVLKFCSYWTETNKSKTKLRWELQPTFDISRRLTTWFTNINTFNKQYKNERKISKL